jgi:hypothetical protein
MHERPQMRLGVDDHRWFLKLLKPAVDEHSICLALLQAS